MFELILITLISAPPQNSIIESQSIEHGMEIDECLAYVSAFTPRMIQLPTGQRMTIKLSCEKREK